MTEDTEKDSGNKDSSGFGQSKRGSGRRVPRPRIPYQPPQFDEVKIPKFSEQVEKQMDADFADAAQAKQNSPKARKKREQEEEMWQALENERPTDRSR